MSAVLDCDFRASFIAAANTGAFRLERTESYTPISTIPLADPNFNTPGKQLLPGSDVVKKVFD